MAPVVGPKGEKKCRDVLVRPFWDVLSLRVGVGGAGTNGNEMILSETIGLSFRRVCLSN